MYIEGTKWEKPQHRVDPDDGMAVIVQIAFELTIPVVHGGIVGSEFRGVIVDAEEHPEKMFRVWKKRIEHYLAVIIVFENVRRFSVGVIIGVDKVQGQPGKDFQKKEKHDAFPVQSIDPEKGKPENQNGKEKSV